MKKTFLFIIMLAMLISGCIITGNILIKVNIGDLTAKADANFDYTSVDLTTNGDWQDNKEDLNSVDDIGFACRIRNNSSTTASGTLYISTTGATGLTTVPANAVLVLDGITVEPGKTREIEWNESYDFLGDFKLIREVVLTEKFTAYWKVSNNLDVDFMDVVLFLSVNGKP